MKVNAIQIDTYSQKAVGDTASRSYSILVDGEKYIVDAVKNTQIQNQNSKDIAAFGANTATVAAKKGYTVIINGEKYIVGAGKEVLEKTNNAKNAIFSVFKKITPHRKNTNKPFNVVA